MQGRTETRCTSIFVEIERTQGGTTVIHLGKRDFDKMVCVNIGNEKHREFSHIIEPIYMQNLRNIHFRQQGDATSKKNGNEED